MVFGSAYTVFRLPEELLTRPITGSNQTLRTISIDYMTRNFSELDHTVSARVRVAIEQVITTSKPDIRTVASMLIMHERTLQRALAAEGTTFNEVLDGTRRDTVHRLLRETDLPMSQITTFAGLREQSALTRAVRRWFGATPQQIRNSARAQYGSSAGIQIQPVTPSPGSVRRDSSVEREL